MTIRLLQNSKIRLEVFLEIQNVKNNNITTFLRLNSKLVCQIMAHFLQQSQGRCCCESSMGGDGAGCPLKCSYVRDLKMPPYYNFYHTIDRLDPGED